MFYVLTWKLLFTEDLLFIEAFTHEVASPVSAMQCTKFFIYSYLLHHYIYLICSFMD